MTTSLDPNRPLPRLVLLTGHSVPIGHVAFSHDGRTLASGSFDGMVILWDLPTNSMRARLHGNDRISDLAFSPDGATLAALDGDAIQLWETTTGRWLRTFPGYKALLAFASSTELVAVGQLGELVRLDRDSGSVLGQRPSSGGNILPDTSASAISPDASIVVLSVTDGAPELQVWDVGTGKLCSTLDYWPDARCLAIFPQNDLLVVGGWSSLWLCDLHNGERKELSRWVGDGIHSLAISCSGRLLAVGTSEGAVKLWELPFGREVQSLAAHTSWVSAIDFSPDGTQLASASHDTTIKIWDVATGECLQRWPGLEHAVSCVSFSADGRTFVSGHPEGTVRWWEASTGILFRTLHCNGRRVTSLSFSEDGQTLACSSTDPDAPKRFGAVELWSLETGARLQGWEVGSREVDSVSLLTQRRLLVASDIWDGDLEMEVTCVWNCDSGELCYQVDGSPSAVSPDGMLLATWVLDDEVISLWETATGARVRNLAQRNGVATLRFSPDGTNLLVGSRGSGMALWSVATGELLWDADTHADFREALAFSPDGRMVAVGGSENELQLWRLWPHVEKVQTLSAHADNVVDISFHPAGHQLVSASADGTLKVWDVAEDRLLATFLVLPTTDGTISEEWITFTPAGHYVGSAGVDGYVNWQVEEKLLPAEAFGAEFHRPDLVAEALQPE